MIRSALRTAGVTLTLAAATAAAWRSLASLPMTSPAPRGLEEWYAEVGPLLATTFLLHLIVLACLLWLTAAALLHLASGTWPAARRLRDISDRLAPATLRRICEGTVAASFAVTLSIGPPMGPGVGAPVAEPGPGTATIHPVDLGGTSPGTATLHPADPVEPPVAAPVAPPVAVPAPARTTVIVHPGDNFWVIAEDTLRQAWGRDAGDREVADYWHRLIAANLDRLVVRGNADLLYPGQELVVPAVDAGSASPASALPDTL